MSSANNEHGLLARCILGVTVSQIKVDMIIFMLNFFA